MKKKISLIALLFALLIFAGSCENHSHSTNGGTSYSTTERTQTKSEIVSTTVVSTSSTTQENEGSESVLKDRYTLYVNGVQLPDTENMYIDRTQRCVYLPVIQMMRAIGATVIWKTETVAEITYQNVIYELDTTAFCLSKVNDFENYIAPPPGTMSCYFELIDDEFYADSDSMRYFMTMIGLSITIDYKNAVVTIQQ